MTIQSPGEIKIIKVSSVGWRIIIQLIIELKKKYCFHSLLLQKLGYEFWRVLVIPVILFVTLCSAASFILVI